MGVHELTPFLKKRFPSIIKSIPNRFQDLQGKTVVIDATLITQRFHFARVPHQYKHVLGWYRLLKELRDNGVNAICIFDGDDRSVAKLQEAERRRLARRLVTVRSSLEAGRLKRLQGIQSILHDFQRLSPKSPAPTHTPKISTIQAELDSLSLEASGRLKKEFVESPTAPQSEVSEIPKPEADQTFPDVHEADPAETTDESTVQPREDADEVKPEPEVKGPQEQVEQQPQVEIDEVSELDVVLKLEERDRDLADEESDVLPALKPEAAETAPLEVPTKLEDLKTADRDLPSDFTDNELASSDTGQWHTDSIHPKDDEGHVFAAMDYPGIDEEDSPTFIEDTETESEVQSYTTPTDVRETQLSYDELWAKLDNLREGYLRYVKSAQSGITASAASTSEAPTIYLPSPSLPPDDNIQESKFQVLLTRGEERLWIDLMTWRYLDMHNYSPTQIADLLDRSQVLHESYERRSNAPTFTTYEECKMMIRAMGIPCIDCDGPYEAEALASSIVQEGKADFVASEDTDVLVYGASLLRNITSREKALQCISGEDIREALNLHGPSFVDFALLLGTDFSARLHSLGPTRALRFIAAHGTIERVIKKESKYAPADVDAYLEQVRIARQVFTTLPPVPSSEQLATEDVDRESVTKLLGRFRLMRAAFDDDWDPQVPLAGNYFQDSPYVRKRRTIADEEDEENEFEGI